MKLAPHVERLTPEALTWVQRAGAVKSIDNVDVLKAARSDALLVWRHYLANQDMVQPFETVDTIISALSGFRAPGRLVLELWNEGHPTAEQLRIAVTHAHAQGFLVAAGSWGTGDFTQDDWNAAVTSGADFIAAHGYFTREVGPTPWNAYRYRQFWKSGQPRVLITETGIDTCRDGANGTMIGKPGWKANGLSAEQYNGLLMQYAMGLEYDSAVAFAFPFTCGPTNDWADFDCDPIAGWLAQQPQTTWKPIPKPGGTPMPTVDYALAIADWSPNFGYPTGTPGRNGETIEAIVDHIEQGTETATDAEFDNPDSDASSTYSVSLTGVVRQHRPESDAAWANGIDFSKGYAAYQSDLTIPWIKDCWARNVSPNLKTISIEHEGKSGEPMPEAQYRASLALKLGILNRHPSIPRAPLGLLGHHHIDNVTRHYCPGAGNPRDRFLHDLGLDQGEELTAEQKKAVLDDLATIWGFSDKEQIAKNPEQSQNAIRERVVAVKVALGLNG